ncbi:type II toxin-antitoxin system RelE/ParE family toxin [Akkermansiaceae bacterium]|nr:type II toxin-antitoxin system RelE/ParE family toxin [Akkermansiaceae bacterium]MDB4544906.1 type II toxin-antitoxin system RelE/ParE family toxin [Akkermansiaceae bacterium]
MKVEFTTEARDDLFEAVDYYESKEEGLGGRMRDEISKIIRTVEGAPYLWSERSAGYRRVNCPVFPYYVAYVIRGERIVIVAVVHGSRIPGFWHKRMKQ